MARGRVSDISGVGNVNLEDNSQLWVADAHNDQGVLILKSADPKITFMKVVPEKIIDVQYTPNPKAFLQKGRENLGTYSYTRNTVVAVDEHHWHVDGDAADLASLKIHYHLSVGWTTDGGTPTPKVEIYDDTNNDWDEVVVDGFSKGIPKSGTHTISANIGDFISANGIIKLRLNPEGLSTIIRWNLVELTVTGTWTTNYDGSTIVIDDTVAAVDINNPAYLITLSNLDSIGVHIGDEYIIGERNDVLLAKIFSEETTGFTSSSFSTSTKYTARDFTNVPCLEIIRSCMDIDNAEYWNDVGTGFQFMYKTSFVDSTITIDEGDIKPDSFHGGYSSDSIIMKAEAISAHRSGISAAYEAGGYAAGDPTRFFYKPYMGTYTELYQFLKNKVDARAAAHFVGGFDLGVDTAAYQGLTVGQTVDLGIDLTGNAADDISENNILVRKIRRVQEINGPLETYIEVGLTPLNVAEKTGQPGDQPSLDGGYGTHRLKIPDPTFLTTAAQANAGDPGAGQIHFGGLQRPPIDFEADVLINRVGVRKFKGSGIAITIGTAAVNEDLDGYGDLEVTDDVIATDDVFFGASAFSLLESGGNAVFGVTDGLVVTATNDPQIAMYEDANNQLYIGYNKTLDRGEYHCLDGGAKDDHYFYDNIYYDGVIDVFDSHGQEGDLALLRAIKENAGSGTVDKTTLPESIRKSETGVRVGGLQGFLLSLVKVLDNRITELENQLKEKTS
jgi:hypothetical protein